ncbi:hypothetical protein [Spongorhabdus nitratireducens]
MVNKTASAIHFLYHQFSHRCLAALLAASCVAVTTDAKAERSSSGSQGWAEQSRKYSEINFFPQKKSHNLEQSLGRAVYKAVDDPAAVGRKAAGALFYGSLDLVGLDDEVKAMVDYVEEKTEFEFGECGEVKLRNELRMETCLNNETSLRFRSDYDMGDVKLEFNWRF